MSAALALDFDRLAVQAERALDALRDAVFTAAHPQEFGVDGCPACQVRDRIDEAAQELREVRELIALWQPESKS